MTLHRRARLDTIELHARKRGGGPLTIEAFTETPPRDPGLGALVEAVRASELPPEWGDKVLSSLGEMPPQFITAQDLRQWVKRLRTFRQEFDPILLTAPWMSLDLRPFLHADPLPDAFYDHGRPWRVKAPHLKALLSFPIADRRWAHVVLYVIGLEQRQMGIKSLTYQAWLERWNPGLRTAEGVLGDLAERLEALEVTPC